MSTRNAEWMEEFGQIVNDITDEDVKALILDGSIEICPVCLNLSAYAIQDANAYDAFPDGNSPPFFKPKKDCIAHIGTADMSSWQCGHCNIHVGDANSPLNHPAYTHSED